MGKSKRTLMDHYISTCVTNVTLPVCGEMTRVIHDLKPMAHQWCGWPVNDTKALPNSEITWPDSGMCIYTPKELIHKGLHRFCVDIDYTGPGFDPWFSDAAWNLAGAIVFQLNSKVFDVIPLVSEATVGMMIMPEVQLHYTLTDNGWAWCKSDTGPVNALFHSFFLDRIEDHDIDEVYTAINMLGNTMQLYLGTYYHWLQQPGKWFNHSPKKPRVKIKNGKVNKFYDEGTAGYKEYIHTKEEKTND